MKKALIVALMVPIAWLTLLGTGNAVTKDTPFQVCVSNGDGTYTQVFATFANSDQALAISSMYDTYTDLWPAFTYSQVTSQVNVPASKAFLHKVTTTYTYTDRYGIKHTVTSTTWQVDPAKKAIYDAGCVT